MAWGVVFDVEWLFVYGALFLSPGFSDWRPLILTRPRQESCNTFGPIQQLVSVRHNWGKAPLVRAPSTRRMPWLLMQSCLVLSFLNREFLQNF